MHCYVERYKIGVTAIPMNSKTFAEFDLKN